MDSLNLFDSIMDSAVLLDKTGHVLNWNAGAASLFGYSKKEILGRSINLIYDHHYPFQKLIHELQFNQKKWQEETRYIRKNGVNGYCKSQLCPIITQDTTKIAALLIHQNISAYKKTEEELTTAYDHLTDQYRTLYSHFFSANFLLIEALNNIEQLEKKRRESELGFHLLAENATDVISRHAPDGSYLYISPAIKSALGYRPEDLIGKSIYKFIHHDDVSKIKKSFTRRREHTENKPLIYRLKRKEGEFRWFESKIRLIRDEYNKIISEIQLASRDITDRVMDKKARLRGQQLAHVFRLSTMEEMASGMAHEISQPLAALVNYTRGCVRHLENNNHDSNQLRDVMAKAVAQAERAGEILQRLKNFFCKGQLVKTSCKVNNVIRETVTLIKNELTLSKTKIDINLDKDIPYIYVDKIQIQQVLLNLIQNAIESMQQHHIKEKRIHIEVGSKGIDAIEITISDTGPGFTKEIIHKAFTPFFTTKAHGRGMGLAICRSIIEAHGGQFTINSNATNNSWIRFSLPKSDVI